MEEINPIISRLNELYEEYKNNNHKLSAEKISESAALMIQLGKNNGSYNNVGIELVKFPTDSCKAYFDMLTRNCEIASDVLDEIIAAFVSHCNNKGMSKSYAAKYYAIITIVMNNCRNTALKSRQIPLLIIKVAGSSIGKNEELRNKFYNLINSTQGCIFQLDYSEVRKDKLECIFELLKMIYVDMFASQYADIIKEWCEKYGLIDSDDKNDNPDTTKKIKAEVSPKTVEKENVFDKFAEKETNITDQKQLLNDIEKLLADQNESIKKAVKNETALLSDSMLSITRQISEIQELIYRNWHYHEKINELEERIKMLSQKLTDNIEENNAVKTEKSVLEEKCSELDQKLKEAYSMNSRESSLEAEKLKAELSNSMMLCYEDWLEYESAEFSEENYESLQAMIKRIFRALEKNNINFKG